MDYTVIPLGSCWLYIGFKAIEDVYHQVLSTALVFLILVFCSLSSAFNNVCYNVWSVNFIMKMILSLFARFGMYCSNEGYLMLKGDEHGSMFLWQILAAMIIVSGKDLIPRTHTYFYTYFERGLPLSSLVAYGSHDIQEDCQLIIENYNT